jgi:hypothetical protein
MADYGFNLNLGPQTKPSSLSDMLNLASGAQQLQQNMQMNPLQLQEARQRLEQSQQMNPLLLQQQKNVVGKSGIELEQLERTNKEIIAMQTFLSNPDNYMTNGVIDDNKLNAAVPRIAPLNGAKFISELTTLGKAQSENQEAINKLGQNERAIVANPLALRGRTGEVNPAVYIEDLKRIKEENPNSKGIQRFVDLQIKQLEKSKPGKHIAQSAIMGSEALLGASDQIGKFAPEANLTDVGGQLVETIKTPSTGGNLPSISVTGASINKTLQPGTQVIAGKNDPYNLPEGTKYILPTNQPQSTKPAVTALDPTAAAKLEAESGAVKSAAEVGTQDWSQTYKESKDASNTIASLQTIKKLVPDTFTGVGGERKKFIAGLAQAVGIPAYELETTSTDELMKNTKILQLAGGNTDAARQISELANPNVRMTKDAILNVVNQLVGMNKMKIARADYLAPYANNPEEYSKKSQLFNKFADYRLFQELTAAEVKKMKLAMSPAERDEISKKIKEAQMAGIIK